MIICKLTDVANSNYFDEESVKAIADFIKKHDLKTLSVGSYPLNEGNKVNVSQYVTKENDCVCEAHKRYADVQVIIDGVELLKLATEEDCEVTKPYDETKDLLMLKGDGKDEVVLKGGSETDCVIFYPEEIHQPGLCVDTPALVKKAVFKILCAKK